MDRLKGPTSNYKASKCIGVHGVYAVTRGFRSLFCGNLRNVMTRVGNEKRLLGTDGDIHHMEVRS